MPRRNLDTVRPPSSREEDRQQLLFCPHYLARIEQIRLRDSEVYLADFRRLASGLDPIYDDEHRPPRLRLRTLRPSHSVQPSTRRPQAIASRVEGRCEHQLGREQHRRGRCQLHCRPVASKRDSSKPNRKRTAFEHDAAQKAVVPNFWVVHPAAGRGDTWPTAVNGHPYLSAKGGCERLHLATAAGPGGAVGTPAVAGSDGAEQ